ncbi:efflux RND transporter permease subunit [Massilimaliae timonensis]|uniref:Efflux RND transporter permease subunit n=1 Tax=Massiliimalia timonensis TaxID=1987501 RepID=A0A8J6TP40_9FIRM|nr:efflux RND transporter permease subunit [Massiliimalia timonensis]MBC8609759.1 efflux RND transporter permease subunit [Massiliimalia timonensis]
MLSEFSVKKPFTVVVAVIMVLVLGFISFTHMTPNLMPNIDFPYVIVTTAYPGASPEKVESSVTKPLEQALSTTAGMKNITSTSSENFSMVMLEFNQNINMDSVMINVNNTVSSVSSSFDDTVGTPSMMKLNPDMMAVMMASVDVDGMDSYEVSEFVQNTVVPEFERIDGIASVTATGLVEEQLQIKLDQGKIDALNDKILKNVDEELSKAEDEIQSGKKKLKDQRADFESQSEEQKQKLVDASSQMEDGKTELQSVIDKIGMTKQQLEDAVSKAEETKETLSGQLETAQDMRDQMAEAGLDTTEIDGQIKLLQDGITQADTGITQAKQGIQAYDALDTLKEQEKELESGKITLTQKLTEASVQLTNAEGKLEEAEQQFEEQREEAYQNAGLDGVITVDMIQKMLQAENFSMPAGYLSEGNAQYLIKVGDEFADETEIKDLLLFSTGVDGVGDIYLKDVAEVSWADNAGETYAKINGNDGILLSFEKSSTASTTEATDAVHTAMDSLMENNPDLHITALMDQGVYIDIIIKSVLDNLLYGGILAIIVLLLFLKTFKPTLIIATSIPISLLFAMVLMYFSGVTLNIISLSGLALGVGMLVDNSIVVIENIYRLRNLDVNKRKAAVQGAKQVAGAITSSTLTTICVFLPIVFTDGLTRQLFADMGLTIAYSLVASLFVALTLVPTMSSTILNKADEKKHPWFDAVVNGYEKLLRFCLRKKVYVLSFTIVLLILSGVLVARMGTAFMPDVDSTQMSATLTMPDDSDKEDTYQMSDTFMERALEIEDVQTVGAMQAGNIMGMGTSDPGEMTFYILLDEDKKHTNKEVAKMLEEKTADLNCEVDIAASTMDMSMLGGSGIELVIHGTDLDQMAQISKDMTGILEGVEGTTDITNGLEDASAEVRVIVNKNKAMEYGLTVAQVYQAVSGAISTETNATTLSADDADYPVIILNDSDVTRSNLGNYELEGTKDQKDVTVKLSDIASIEEAESPLSISHDNQTRTMTVSALVDEDHNIGLVSRDVEKQLDDYELPSGYTVTLSGENETINQSLSDLVLMIGAAVLFIYLIMVAQFQSLVSPFIVLFTLPLAFTGGLLALVMTGSELSVVAMLGFLVLAGIVVNNGIVFVDYTNQLRLDGMEKKEALVQTGRTRIRPILMTAMTTVLAMSTMAIGVGTGSEMTQPLAIVVIGGLTYATLLTLFVVPCIYDLLRRKDLKPIVIEDEEQKHETEGNVL